MKKTMSFVLALFLILGFGYFAAPSAHADVQIDEGQLKSTAAVVFFIGRYARTGNENAPGGTHISADSVVIWDTTSADGVTIRTTTTSFDALVAGVTMDRIPGSSRDNTASEDDAYNNWGRVQTWGLHQNVRFQATAGIFNFVAGQRVSAASTSGDATVIREISADATATTADFRAASRDDFGVLLEDMSATEAAADVHIRIT